MGVKLTVNDLFDMAIQIEKEAQAFFREAAMLYAGPQSRQFLLDLAALEREHEVIFETLKEYENLCGRGSAEMDPEGPEGPPLISARVFISGVQSDLARQFTGKEKPYEIIRRAIEFEKDTIVFLVDMKQRLSDQADKGRIDTLIREELGHIVKLVGHMGSL